MNEEVQLHIDEAKELMMKANEHLVVELAKLRAGKASPGMLDGIRVDYYGTMTPLAQVASVNTPDARTLAIMPFEKALITPIEKAVTLANLGFNPTNDGQMIRINIPPITEDRRKDLVKRAKAEGENARITIRNIRREALESIKKMTKNGLSEDEAKTAEGKLQEVTNTQVAKVDDTLVGKEKDIMTV